MKKILATLLLFIFCSLVMMLTVRGLPGTPSAEELNTSNWKEIGPFELSPEKGRYALLYSVVENNSVWFSVDLARFTAPDVAYVNGHYASLFAPAVSYIIIPGYIIGKYFGAGQVGSFAVIAIFALMNVFLIRSLVVRLGGNRVAGAIAGAAFLFASPAFSYAVTLYQHHISTFLILLSLYLLIRFKGLLSLLSVWILFGISITVDYPNFFMMIPIVVFALSRIFFMKSKEGSVHLKIYLLRTLQVIGLILPIMLFFWFNKASYGNPYQLSGAVQRATIIDVNGEPLFKKEILENSKNITENSTSNNSTLGFFKNRNILNGFYILFLSQDRGMLYFTPVMLVGFLGGIIALRRKGPYVPLIFAVLGFNIILYSMWGDPYGGWAFGGRYLIPGYAMLSIFLGLLLTEWRSKNIFLLTLFVLMNYSLAVNTLGALTSNSNPPKVEAEYLSAQSHRPEPYTYQRNMNILNNNLSRSYVFQTFWQNYFDAWNYFSILTTLLILVNGFLLLFLRAEAAEEEKHEDMSFINNKKLAYDNV